MGVGPSKEMVAKLLELITGKDDLERVAWKEDLALLNARLRTRRLLVPRRPRRFLDPASFTEEQLLELIKQECEDFSGPFQPWILEMDGKKRLPAFSSRKKLELFQGEISKRLNKVFGLGAGEFLLADLAKDLDIDFVDLNLFDKKSWEIGVRSQSER